VAANLARYGAFYLATSLGLGPPPGVLTAVLVMVAGGRFWPACDAAPAVLRSAPPGSSQVKGAFQDRPAAGEWRRDECLTTQDTSRRPDIPKSLE
jgi:hypothetical protein